MAEIDAIRLCSSALVLLGEEPIISRRAGDAPSKVALNRYDDVRDALLSSHPWNFTRAFVTLTRIEMIPGLEWNSAFARPAGLYRLVRVLVNGTQAQGWELATFGLMLNTAANDVVVAEFHGGADEALFSPMFRQALVYKLAAEFAIPLTEDVNRMGVWNAAFEREIARARHHNATEHQMVVPNGQLAGLRRR